MAWWSPRRGRTRGVTLRISNGPQSDLGRALRDRGTWLRLLLCLVTVGALLVAVQAWQVPFPYRLYQKPVHGVTARLDFTRINRERTNRAKDRAAEQVPYIFANDPKPLRVLPDQFKTALLQFATAKTLKDLPPEIRTSFGLEPKPAAASATTPPRDPQAAFDGLKTLASDEKSVTGTVNSFAGFVKELQVRGLVTEAELKRNNIQTVDPLAVGSRGEELRRVTPREVVIQQALAPAGLLFDRWEAFPQLQPIRPELEAWLIARAPETLHYDDVETQRQRKIARDTTPEVLDVFPRGTVLVQPGEMISESSLEVLLAEAAEIDRAIDSDHPWQRPMRVLTVAGLFLVLGLLSGYYLVRRHPELVASFSRLTTYLGLFVLTVFLCRQLSLDPWRASVGPLLVMVMIVAIAYNQALAILTGFSLALIVTLSTFGELSQFIQLMTSAATSVILLPRVSSRSTVVMVGVWSAVAYFVMYWGMAILQDQASPQIWFDATVWYYSLLGAGWCIAAGFLVSGSLPFIEAVFGVVTDISLLELGDVSHPLLQELVRRAPGTYNHSMTVASIAETAAENIGANGLLVRVGAYFHDIGKMLKPHYFVENTMAGEGSRHENLAPAMSTLIIIGHVKDGIDLGQQHHLPAPLIDFIEQHHGTTLVEYFYREATRLAEEDPDHRSDAEESQFRYPGPKPQTREAGVLMLADAVEGASRTLSEPTPKRIERLVHDIATKRLNDGQFDDCGLTITELAHIEDSLTKSLIAIYHARIKYPDQKDGAA